MRALITNDDGIDSVGLHTLARIAVAAGLDVTVAAPHQERSGSSAALSALEAEGRLLVERRALEGLDGVTALAVQATPAMIVFSGARGAFGDPPDIVLSGINHGPNTGAAILHSGTVGAALTAVSHNLPAMAVSLATTRPTHWDTAGNVATQALQWFLERTDRAYVLNVNVPDIPPDRLRGLTRGGLANFGAVQANIGERGQGYVTMTFEVIDKEPAPDTDVALLRQGFASATVLQAPCESFEVDVSTLGTGRRSDEESAGRSR
jgi:5'-nucleotidase